jgi:tetratricopeptide (TPR) repeat protein
MHKHVRRIVVAVTAGTLAAILLNIVRRDAPRSAETLTVAPLVGMPGAPTTSAEGLNRRITEMEERLEKRPEDSGAAVLLADALLRQARVTTSGRPAGRAADVLKAVLKENPAHYEAKRMLGAAYLSQHRFRDALDIGMRARDQRPDDAWNYGIIGDAYLELGQYEKAFDAFDTMVAKRPSPAAYARIAYARELQGNFEGALQAMQMAMESTSAHDPEAQAWYASQVGELYLRMAKLEQADREYRRASFIFPNYPLAVIGQGKVKAARGDHDGALAMYLDQMKRTPTFELAARIGDVYGQRHNRAAADRYYQIAEDLAGPDLIQTEAALALFLAEHGRRMDDAVKMAEAVAATRQDIFTDDALAWAYYRAGRLDDALAASRRALRTGSRDSKILAHASEIREAAGRTQRQRGVLATREGSYAR